VFKRGRSTEPEQGTNSTPVYERGRAGSGHPLELAALADRSTVKLHREANAQLGLGSLGIEIILRWT